MKTINKIVAGTVAVFSLAAVGLVSAHPGMGMGSGMGWGMHGGMHGGMYGADNAAARLADLKSELKITAAQDGAWQSFVAVMQQQAAARDALRAQMQGQMQGPNATPADRSAHFEAMSKFRDEHLAARSAALKDLYAVLTPEQKLIADQRLMPGRGPGMAWRAPAK